MTSLPGAFVGGILLGLIEAFANADFELIPGLSSVKQGAELAVFAVLLIVLLVRPRGLMGREA
jgi:branched-chain amino acid transport system permease protein